MKEKPRFRSTWFCLIILIFFCVSSPAWAARYYIDPQGSNSSGDGSQGNPWKTLSYASSQVTVWGDVIHVNTGTYNETQISYPAVGTSIEGEGNTSIIKAWNGATPVLNLSSSAENTNGNQSISYLKFDGNAYAGQVAIRVLRRGNVKIHNCTFEQFDDSGIEVSGSGVSNGTPPTTYATQAQIYSNTINDCSKNQGGWLSGTIQIGGTDGAKIYSNTINNEVRAGHGIKYNYCDASVAQHGNSCNKGLEIYSNEINVKQNTSSPYVFAIELWDTSDDSQIYDNTIKGEINIDTAYPGGGTYAVDIYHNTIFRAPPATSSEDKGITTDRAINKLVIRENYIYGKARGIKFNCNGPVQNVEIYQNTIIDMTTARSDAIMFTGGGASLSNIRIWNNIIDHGSDTDSKGINFAQSGTVNSLEVKNNIFRSLTGYAVQSTSSAGSMNQVYVTHNVYYNVGGFSMWSSTVTNKTESNNFDVYPDLIDSGTRPAPYYEPKEGGNLIDAGVNVGLPYLGSAPDIGAYEYGQDPPPPGPPASPSISIKNLQ